MKINDYLKRHELEPIDFAKLVNCSLDSVFRWKRGCKPSKAYMMLIETATKGAIKQRDWS